MSDRTITRHNPSRARTRFLPGSTFKIPNTLIALETGVAPGADFEIAWDESLRPTSGFWAKSWSQDHTLRSALQNSVYWYYQELARRIGSERMQLYLDQFEYGNKSMAGGLDQFWLHGDLRISPDEQVRFLQRLYSGELGVSGKSTEILKDLLVLEDGGDFRLSGKTGTVGVAPGRELAWLVGYVERGERVFLFALNVEGEEVWERWGQPDERLELVRSILRELSVLRSS
jgi:beta-lactamase class D